ncbi:MAG: hypothetical protein Q8P72_01210 [Candidatus Roizmanbacteria bacterium]|nr:hypothetical protein [Candidatus Roizmanbacteria bacterium]
MTRYVNIQKAKNEAWKLYEEWRKVGINSPAFKCKVRFSLIGWRHIIGASGHKKRTSYSTYRKLKLLPYAKIIIEQSRLIQNIRKTGYRTYYALEGMVKVEENEVKEFRKVRVVIIDDYQNNMIFYSVMDKKEKRRK